MKKQKLSLVLGSIILIIGFIISTSAHLTLYTLASTNGQTHHSTIDSFDRFSWKWNPSPIIVSREGTMGAYNPSIATDSDGTVHIVWDDWENYTDAGTDRDIIYRRWNAESTDWDPIEIISTEGSENSYAPAIAVDTTGNIHIVWVDKYDYDDCGTDEDIFYRRWDASLSTWSKYFVVSSVSDTYSTQPEIATDHFGNAHIVWKERHDYDGSGTDDDIFYRRWDKITSFLTTTEVVSTVSTGTSELPSIDIDTAGNAHITWQDDTDYLGAETDDDIFYRSRWAFLSSWTSVAIVSDESNGSSWFPTIAVDSADNINIAWFDDDDIGGSGSDTDIHFKQWTSASASWGDTEIVSTESDSYSLYPSLAVDSSGVVHIAWEDQSNYHYCGIERDTFYKRRDPITLWTLTEVVSRESTDNSEKPSLAVDEAGIVHIAYFDKSDFGFGTDYDIYYRQLTGPPPAPNLAYIVPNPTDTSTINLEWGKLNLWQILYHVYRSDSYIYSVEGLTPIATVLDSTYVDDLLTEGFYYYVVLAENFVGKSPLSNCQYIEYDLPSLKEFGIVSGIVIVTSGLFVIAIKIRKRKFKSN